MTFVREALRNARDKVRFNKYRLKSLDHVVRRNLFMVNRDHTIDNIVKTLEKTAFNELPGSQKKHIISQLEQLREELKSIASEYATLWMQRYKFPLLNWNLDRIDAQVHKIQDLIYLAMDNTLAIQE